MTKKLMLKQLASMLASFKRKKKYYCEVEYIENTGVTSARNWINTTIVPDSNTRWEVRVAFNNTTTGKLMGSGYATPTRFNLGIESSKFRFAFNAWFDANSNITTPDTNAHTWIIDAPSKTFTIDEYSTTITQTFGETTFPIALFGRCNSANGSTETSNTVVGKIYYTKIWQNNVLVRDMIPVLDWNYVPCMYDKVTDQLFYNVGTGNFTYGREIHQVDYIQTIYSESGNSFIDTGYYPNLNTKVEFMASGISADTFIGASGGTWFTGGREAYLQKMFGSYYNPGYQKLYFGFSTSLSNADYSTVNMYGDNKKFVLDKTGLYINDTKVVNNTDTTNFTSPATLAIFGLNNNGTIISSTGMKLQYYKVWDNGVLTRDYIPMVDENGVGALFDKVTHTIYDAVGTGTGFKYPPVEVEYLESTGTQWINTGINVDTSTDEIKLYFQLKETENYKWFFGEYDTDARIGLGSGDGTDKRNFLYQQTATKVSDTQMYNTQHLFEANSNGGFLDGTKIRNHTSFASTSNIYLFNLNIDSPSNYRCKSKIWGYEHKRNGVLVRNLMPCYKDGVACMVDKLTGTVYLNQGTGDFVIGKVKESEYLE